MLHAWTTSASGRGAERLPNACQAPPRSPSLLAIIPHPSTQQGDSQGPFLHCRPYGENSWAAELDTYSTDLGQGPHQPQQRKEEQVQRKEKEEQNNRQQQPEFDRLSIGKVEGASASPGLLFLPGPPRGPPTLFPTATAAAAGPATPLRQEKASLSLSSGRSLDERPFAVEFSQRRWEAPPLQTDGQEVACFLPSGVSGDDDGTWPTATSMEAPLADAVAPSEASCVAAQHTENQEGILGPPLPSEGPAAVAGKRSPSTGIQSRGPFEPNRCENLLSERVTHLPLSLSPPPADPQSNRSKADDGLPSGAPAAAVAEGDVTRAGRAFQEQLGALIHAAVERFESVALQRMEALVRQTWAPRQKKLWEETELSMQMNSRLLQALHLEGLNTDDLRAVLALSEELRRYGARGALPEAFLPASSPALHLRPAYSWGDPPDLNPESPGDFVVTPRGTVREVPGRAQERMQFLDAIDERDGFSDILRVCERTSLQGGGPPMVYSRVAGASPRARTSFVRGSRSSTVGSRETAAAADIAVAAATAAEFMGTSSGRKSPSAFIPRAHRRRARQGPPRRVGGSRRSLEPVDPEGPSERQGEMPVKRFCRGAGARRMPLIDVYPPGSPIIPQGNLPEGTPCEATIGQQMIFRRDGEVTFRLAAGGPTYFVLGPPADGLAASGAPCMRSAHGTRRPGLRCSSSGSTERETSSSSAAPPIGPSGPLGPPYRGTSGTAADSLISSCRSPVKGVYYDSFKKLWRVQWHTSGDISGATAEGKRMSRSFSCSRLGFDLARARAVAWMLSGGLVGDHGGLIVGGVPDEGTPDIPSVCATLAAATHWDSVQDCHIKEFVVFYDPKRFLTKVEGYYVAQKLCGGAHASAPFRTLPNSSNNSSVNDSSNRESEIGVGGPSPLSSEGMVFLPVARGPWSGRKGTRGNSASNRQRTLSCISLDKMLEIVWGAPQEAAACIMAKGNRESPPQEAEAPQGTKITSERISTTSTAASAEGCLIKPETVL